MSSLGCDNPLNQLPVDTWFRFSFSFPMLGSPRFLTGSPMADVQNLDGLVPAAYKNWFAPSVTLKPLSMSHLCSFLYYVRNSSCIHDETGLVVHDLLDSPLTPDRVPKYL